MEDVKNKLKKEESKRRESENKLASEKNAWNSERSQLQARVKKVRSYLVFVYINIRSLTVFTLEHYFASLSTL